MENFLKGNLTNNEINCKRQKFYYNDYILYRKKFLSIENYQKNINISTVYAINNMKVKLSKEGGEKIFFSQLETVRKQLERANLCPQFFRTKWPIKGWIERRASRNRNDVLESIAILIAFETVNACFLSQ